MSAVSHFSDCTKLSKSKLSKLGSGLNFNPWFVFLLSKSLSRIIFSILFRVSNHHCLVGKENLTEFAFEALIYEFKFLTNPGLP